MKDLSLLVLGTGWWGGEWLRAISTMEGIQLVGTAGQDSSLPQGVPLAATYRHYADYREALVAAEADAVLVVLPVGLHADAVLRSIALGRHVICEKPAASTSHEVRRILSAADERPDLVVMINQNYRWRPWARVAREKISGGLVGSVQHVSIRFSQPELLAGGRENLRYPLLQDMCIHHFDLLRFLTGTNAEKIYARAYRPVWSLYEGPPGLDAIITMENDLPANYSGTWAGRGAATAWEGDWRIQGDRGLLALTDGVLTFYRHGSQADSAAPPAEDEVITLEVPVPDRSDLQTSLESFVSAVRSGKQAETEIRDNMHSIAMVFSAERSIASGSTVRVSLDDEVDVALPPA